MNNQLEVLEDMELIALACAISKFYEVRHLWRWFRAVSEFHNRE
jgi:hypothetical protein